LLPLLTGKSAHHHEALYWSSGGSTGDWAIRRGDWKLHGLRDQIELINLAADPSEKKNLSAEQPERVKELTALFDSWLDSMAPPMTSGVSKKWGAANNQAGELDERAKKRQQRKQERKGKKTMESEEDSE